MSGKFRGRHYLSIFTLKYTLKYLDTFIPLLFMNIFYPDFYLLLLKSRTFTSEVFLLLNVGKIFMYLNSVLKVKNVFHEIKV